MVTWHVRLLEDAHTILAQACLIVLLELAYHVDWTIDDVKDSPLVETRCSTLIS
jgi:hypothetical protein